MAYTDITSRPSQVSLGAALCINGLIIVGIIFAAPDVAGEQGYISTAIKFITPPEAKPDPVLEKPKPKPDPGIIAKPVVQPPAPPTTAKSENEISVQSRLLPFPPLPPFPPGDDMIIEKPPVTLEPVYKAASIHPKYRDALQPEYPPGLIRQEIEGRVTLRVLIGTDGRVKAVEPVRFDDEGFLEVTRAQALRKWRFLPATRDGTPVESWREMTVRFQIPR